MKLIRAFLLSLCFLFKLQAQDSILIKDVVADSLVYQNTNNFFSHNDELDLLTFNLLEQSSLSNDGIPLISWWWKANRNSNLALGDVNTKRLGSDLFQELTYSQLFPHTKIVYRPTLNEGQRVNFLHKRQYKYGALEIDYDRLISQGLLFHEKKKHTSFKFRGSYRHPKFPVQSDWRFRTFKNETEWNGGISDDSLFLSGNQSNWELLPIYWTNLKTLYKHKDFEWRNRFNLSEKSQLLYSLSLSQDSLFYEGLQDDSLFFPHRLDSMSATQISAYNTAHSIYWIKEMKRGRQSNIGLTYQNRTVNNTDSRSQLLFSGSLASSDLNNNIQLSYAIIEDADNTLSASYEQKLLLFGLENKFKMAYSQQRPSWMHNHVNDLYQSGWPNPVIYKEEQNTIDQSIDWLVNINEALSIQNSYHNIDHYRYYDENGLAAISEQSIQVFQCRFKHHLQLRKWHWHGDAAIQNSSSELLPLAKILLNQKVYWQGKLFKEATEMQIGLRALYRSSHSGMSYSPLLGDVYLNPMEATEASTRLDLFAHLQIQTVKVFMSFDHINSFWQGEQYLLKPYPLPKAIFRLSLIWNFYD